MESLFSCKSTSVVIYSHKVNGTILDAIKQYESRGVPLIQLLTDYNDVISGSNIREAINPWEYLYKGKKNLSVVSGVSVAEALFNTSAMSLYKQKPIEVIKGVYYRNKTRNDSGIERVFLESLFEQIKTEKTLIINPSPFVVEYVEKQYDDACYAVTDQTMAELYSKQYKTSTFFSLNTDEVRLRADAVVLFTHQAEMNSLQRMIEIINDVAPEKVFIILQTRLLDNKKSFFWAFMANGEYAISDIVVMPNEISKSSPKKKCFVALTKEYGIENILIQQTEYNAKNKSLELLSDRFAISKEELLKHNTIKSVMNEQSMKVTEKTSEAAKYSSAKYYTFSKEIYISYAIYSDVKGLYGKAYYAATKNTQLPEIRGKALTPRIERGLRGDSEDTIVGNLENFPYAASQVIVDDIVKCYLNSGKPVTLKTLWFCLREDLKKNYLYDDQKMQAVFAKHGVLCDLYLDNVTGDKILEALSELYDAGEEEKSLHLLKEINIIVTAAISKGYLFENRVLPLLPMAQNRASKRQAEVRQALTKRSFEEEEEQKIMNYVLPLCAENSLYLAVAIRLLTGISLREVCALTWRDFSLNSNTNVYELSITKFADNTGKVISHALEDNWEKYRVLPISQFLSRVLEHRRTYLVGKGLDIETIKDYPIVLSRENISSMLKGHNVEPCKPAVVAKKCRDAVSKAEIEPHLIILPENGADIETDINSYNGDILRTNFRDKAINKAGFGLDELHYYLGLKKPDTFSQHYCDYTNDYVQLIMARKLDRWQTQYMSALSTSHQKKDNVKDEFRGIGDGVADVEINIRCKKGGNVSPVCISVETEHGFKVTVMTPKKR